MSSQGLIIGNKYSLEKEIGRGSFGEIHIGRNIHTDEEVAIKLENIQSKHPQLLYESKVIRFLYGGLGIPEVHWCGSIEKYNVMIIDLLGNSLEDLFNVASRRFSLKTVLMIFDQILGRIQYIHNKGYLHRDIKPDNFLIGRHKQCMIIYAIDFGLAKRFRDSRGNHIPKKEGKNLTGTARYASVNAHIGVEQSRRDDLEAILYVMIYFLKGTLPWQGLNAKIREDKYKLIAEKKKSTKPEVLCADLPAEFLNYLTYVKALKFNEDPNYKMLRKKFRELFQSNEFLYDYEFDWKALGHSSCALQDTIIELVEEKEEDSPVDKDEEVNAEQVVEQFLQSEEEDRQQKAKKNCFIF